MLQIHRLTEHDRIALMKDPHYLAWETQPSSFKTYPHFMKRCAIKDTLLSFLSLTAAVTFVRRYGSSEFFLRILPSAGGLFPTELYVQLRNVKGFDDGIYHYEPKEDRLCMIEALAKGGIEAALQDKRGVDGIILLLSSVYFRSSWKYRNRALRYILLDAGHMLGAIEAATVHTPLACEFVFDFDAAALNTAMGFENKELTMAVAVLGSRGDNKECTQTPVPLPVVCGSDYFVENDFIKTSYTALHSSQTEQSTVLYSSLDEQPFKDAIFHRRSSRSFDGTISKRAFDDIAQCFKDDSLEIFYTLHRVEGLKNGLYSNGALLKEGLFDTTSQHLCLDQKLVGQSAACIYLTSNSEDYFHSMQKAGIIAHRIYLLGKYNTVGCSGIGAFYDNEVRRFLQTENDILYVIVIGKELDGH